MIKQKRPDILIVLAIILAIGVLVTEISYSSLFATPRSAAQATHSHYLINSSMLQ